MLLVLCDSYEAYFKFRRKNDNVITKCVTSVAQLKNGLFRGSDYILLDNWFKRKGSRKIIPELLKLNCKEIKYSEIEKYGKR